MGFDASGKFTARTEDELREMLQMALYGGPKTTGSASLGLTALSLQQLQASCQE